MSTVIALMVIGMTGAYALEFKDLCVPTAFDPDTSNCIAVMDKIDKNMSKVPITKIPPLN